MKPGFLDKLVSRLDSVDPGEVHQLVTRLIREKGTLTKVFEALKEGVIILDPASRIDFVNTAACQFFGLDANRATGEVIASQIRGLDWEGLARPGHTISRDLEVFYPENRYLNFYLAPIEDSGAPLGHVMLVRDLTSTRAEAEETLTIRAAALKAIASRCRAMRPKDMFMISSRGTFLSRLQIN